MEDESALSTAETLVFLQRFKAVVHGTEEPALLAHELDRHLSESTLPEGRDLVRNMERRVLTSGSESRSSDALI